MAETILDLKPLRKEAQARFQIRDLERELAPGRPSRETLQRFAQQIGPGQNAIIHDETGAPFCLASVRPGRTSIDTDALITAFGSQLGIDQQHIRNLYGRTGTPFFEFKEATV